MGLSEPPTHATQHRGSATAAPVELTLACGWSESRRRRFDDESYIQLVTPRKAQGTASACNRRIAEVLIAEGRMTAAGRAALRLPIEEQAL